MKFGISEDNLKENDVQDGHDSMEETEKPKKGAKMIVPGVIAIGITIIIAFSALKGCDRDKKYTDNTGSIVTSTPKPTPTTPPKQSNSSTSENTGTRVPEKEFLDDLEFSSVEEDYVVDKIVVKKDFISYEAKHASIDVGMEIYWLDVEYQDKSYRMMVPYSVFRNMDKKGICIAEIEVTILESGDQIVTHMSVVEDYKDLLK